MTISYQTQLKAWKQFVETDAYKLLNDPSIADREDFEVLLVNRMQRAFEAGMDAGSDEYRKAVVKHLSETLP